MKPILNNDRGVMEVRTHNDGEYAPLRAASGGTDDNSVVTKEDLDTALEGAGGGNTQTVVTTAGVHTMAANTDYISTYAGGRTDFLLPPTSVVGDTCGVLVVPIAGSWRITQDDDQYILGAGTGLATTVGTDGRLNSNNQKASVTLKCVEANLGWIIIAHNLGGTKEFDYV